MKTSPLRSAEQDFQWAEIPTDSALRFIFRRLKGDPESMDDAFFDRIFPDWARQLSRVHWTPLPVARRAVQLLSEQDPEARILDVGSGAGKFCLIGVTVTKDARFFGIEQRPHLLMLSHRLAEHYRIPRLTLAEGNLTGHDWTGYTGIYLFNPFQEHRTPYQRIDSTIELTHRQFDRYVQAVRDRLLDLRSGARVVTYHGFGGDIPLGFRRISSEYCFRGPLECWERL